MPKENILFVCRENLLRSRVAAGLYEHDSRYEVRSAGTNPPEFPPEAPYMICKVVQEHVDWAHRVFAFDGDVFHYIAGSFPHVHNKLINLDIGEQPFNPDDYEDKLAALIEETLIPYLGEPARGYQAL